MAHEKAKTFTKIKQRDLAQRLAHLKTWFFQQENEHYRRLMFLNCTSALSTGQLVGKIITLSSCCQNCQSRTQNDHLILTPILIYPMSHIKSISSPWAKHDNDKTASSKVYYTIACQNFRKNVLCSSRHDRTAYISKTKTKTINIPWSTRWAMARFAILTVRNTTRELKFWSLSLESRQEVNLFNFHQFKNFKNDKIFDYSTQTLINKFYIPIEHTHTNLVDKPIISK